MEEWEPQLHQDVLDLIHEFACIFSQNDLDLGKTSIVKHSILLKHTSRKCWMWVLLDPQIVHGLV